MPSNLKDLFVNGDVVLLVREFLDEFGSGYEPIKTCLPVARDGYRMTFREWWTLLEQLKQRFPHINLGVELGRRVKSRHLGVMGYLSKACPNLLEAFQRIERHQELIHGGDKAILVIREGNACIQWQRRYDKSTQDSDEIVLLGLWQFIRYLIGITDLAPIEVHFIWPKAKSADQLETEFNTKIKFNESYNAIVFPVSLLTRSIHPSSNIVSSNPQIQDVCVDSEFTTPKLTSRSDRENNVTLADTIDHPNVDSNSTTLLSRLLENSDDFIRLCIIEVIRAIKNGYISADHVARQMSLSERTLNRKLNQYGINFRNLLLDTRIGLAQEYLQDGRLSLYETALLVGYADQVAFTRAFKKRVGNTPAGYRSRLDLNVS